MRPEAITRDTLPDLSKGEGHKFDHGHVLVVSGGAGRTGAARLAARGALRIGAGLVTLGSPRSAMAENAAHLTAIMLRQIDGGYGLRELLEDTRISALCLGPGLGLQADTQAIVLTALAALRPTVLDADGLSRFERAPEVLLEQLHDTCVITPHGGEFRRLFPDLADAAIEGSDDARIAAVGAAARRAGCVVLLKGSQTLIADHNGRVAVHSATGDRAVPWLATAGAGDVLAGFIAGLMARGMTPLNAAAAAVWLHVECARHFGPGLIAEDLPEQIPSVLAGLIA